MTNIGTNPRIPIPYKTNDLLSTDFCIGCFEFHFRIVFANAPKSGKEKIFCDFFLPNPFLWSLIESSTGAGALASPETFIAIHHELQLPRALAS